VGQKVNLPIHLVVGQVDQEITVIGQQDVIDAGDANKAWSSTRQDSGVPAERPAELHAPQSHSGRDLHPGAVCSSGFSGTRGWDVNSSYKFNGAPRANGNNVS